MPQQEIAIHERLARIEAGLESVREALSLQSSAISEISGSFAKLTERVATVEVGHLRLYRDVDSHCQETARWRRALGLAILTAILSPLLTLVLSHVLD